MERAIEIDPNVEAEGQRFLVMGAELITLKFRGRQYSVFEHVTQPGYCGPPPHRHLTHTLQGAAHASGRSNVKLRHLTEVLAEQPDQASRS